MSQEPSIQRRVALGHIVENAAEHIRLGLDLVGEFDLIHERSAPILSLLAFGTEHLLKATWVSAVSLRSGEIPTSEDLKKKMGHRVATLHAAVLDEAEQLGPERAAPGITDLAVAMSWRDADVSWMRESVDLEGLLQVLDAYGQQRYVDFDVLMGQKPSSDPRDAWEKAIERMWRVKNPTALGDAVSDSDMLVEMSRRYEQEAPALARAALNRYYRGISRWWWSGLLGENPRTWAGCLQSFVMLSDDSLAARPQDHEHRSLRSRLGGSTGS